MPWKETCVQDERVAFIVAWKQGGSMTGLCEAHGISRKTGYKWVARYEAGGWDALADAPRAPPHGDPGDAPLRRGGVAERSLVHRLQGLVPHARRPALRSADGERCGEPLSPRVPHRRADSRGRTAGLRAAVPRVRPAPRDAHGQRAALRLDWRCRPHTPRCRLGEA